MSTPSGPLQKDQSSENTREDALTIPLPESFQNLSTVEITKLSTSLNVLKGYLTTLIQGEIEKNIDILNGIVKEIESFLYKLQQLEQQKLKTNNKLAGYQVLLQEWVHKEKEMLQVLSRFESPAILKLLTSAVLDSKKLSNSIEQSFIYHPETHDDISIQNFIQVYQKEQKTYHLRQEKLKRLHENRVNGFYI